jgi:hypothetical protein
LVGLGGRHEGDRPIGPTAPPPAAPGPAPDRVVRSQDGAVAAAVQYATLLSRLFPLQRSAAEAVVVSAASDGYRSTLLSAVDQQLVPLQQQAARLAGSTVYRQAVLGTRVERYTVDAAIVSVWTLACIDHSGQASNPLGTFSTYTLSLVWQRGSWRLDGTQQRGGPSPLLDSRPDSAEDFEAALHGFADWRPR